MSLGLVSPLTAIFSNTRAVVRGFYRGVTQELRTCSRQIDGISTIMHGQPQKEGSSLYRQPSFIGMFLILSENITYKLSIRRVPLLHSQENKLTRATWRRYIGL